MNWLAAFLIFLLFTTGALVMFVVLDDDPPQSTNVVYSPMPNLPKPTLPESE